MSFKADLDSDLSHMLGVIEFGSDLTFQPAVGSQESVIGYFNDEFEEIDQDGNSVISSNKPNLTVNLNSFVTQPKQGDVFIANTISYKVIEVQPDGQGAGVILMHETV